MLADLTLYSFLHLALLLSSSCLESMLEVGYQTATMDVLYASFAVAGTYQVFAVFIVEADSACSGARTSIDRSVGHLSIFFS